MFAPNVPKPKARARAVKLHQQHWISPRTILRPRGLRPGACPRGLRPGACPRVDGTLPVPPRSRCRAAGRANEAGLCGKHRHRHPHSHDNTYTDSERRGWSSLRKQFCIACAAPAASDESDPRTIRSPSAPGHLAGHWDVSRGSLRARVTQRISTQHTDLSAAAGRYRGDSCDLVRRPRSTLGGG